MKIDKEKLREIRESKGLTQNELAHKSGISVVTINKIETTDFADPFPSTVSKIAQALGVNSEDFLPESSNKEMSANTLKERAGFVKYLYEIDSFMFHYIKKQMEIFKRDLGERFHIEDCDLFETAIFAGMSWSKKGNTTNFTNYAKVLGNLIALKNSGPNAMLKAQTISEVIDLNNLSKYKNVQCVYGLYTNREKLIRVGMTTCLKSRIESHETNLNTDNDDLKLARELIREDDSEEKHSYKIIVKLPDDKMTGLQRQFFLSYAETRMIIERKTYEQANKSGETSIICGDPYIPAQVALEIWNHYK